MYPLPCVPSFVGTLHRVYPPPCVPFTVYTFHRVYPPSWVLFTICVPSIMYTFYHSYPQLYCKTVNLVVRQDLLDSRRGMLSMNGRSHVILHVLTLRIFGTLKKLRFRQNCREVLNWLNSANWSELHKATYRGHRVRSRARAMRVDRSNLNLRIGRV